jgi:hypothetical protein
MRGNPNFQIPNPKEFPSAKFQNQTMNPRLTTPHLWSLRLGASLELGAWDLELSAVIT